MNIQTIPQSGTTYSSNSYFIRGDMNSIHDKNILIDPGADLSIIHFLKNINGGVGKKKIDFLFITHQHFDHTLMTGKIIDLYPCISYAFKPGPYIHRTFKDKEVFKAGDTFMEVIHTPGHTQDSVCFYFPKERVLFSGDTPLIIRSEDSTYHRYYIETLEKLSQLKIDIIYPGHGKSYSNEGYQSIKEACLKAKQRIIID